MAQSKCERVDSTERDLELRSESTSPSSEARLASCPPSPPLIQARRCATSTKAAPCSTQDEAPTVLVTYCIQNCSMAPKKAVKKLKSAVTAAAATSKKSPDKLRAKVAAAALQEEEEEDVEVNVDDLLKFFKKETPAPAPAPAEASAPAAAAPAPAMADAAPPVSAVTSTETPAIATAAGSAAAAVNAKRSETAATPAADDAKAALEQAGKDALAEALGMVRKAAPPPLDDKALLEALKTARKAVADANKLMTNMVCDTSLLEAIAKSKPKTLKELELVEEFGPTRAERCEQP